MDVYRGTLNAKPDDDNLGTPAHIPDDDAKGDDDNQAEVLDQENEVKDFDKMDEI